MNRPNYEIKGSGYFNGTNSVISYFAVQASLSAYLHGTSGLSWAGWFKSTQDTGSSQVIFSVNNATGVCCNAFINTGTGQISTQSRANAEVLITSTTSLRIVNYGSWYHIVVVADYANNQQKTYVNGVKVRTDANAYSQTTLNMASGTGGIGASPTASFFRGYVADGVRLIRGAVTDAEAYALYLSNTPPATKPTAILCNPSDAYATPVPDYSGNGFTGAVTAGTSSPETPFAPRVGTYLPRLSCRFIPASSARVVTASAVSVTDFTYSTWYKAGSIAAGTYTLMSGTASDTPKIQINASDQIELHRVGTGATATTGAVISRKGEWQHLTVTYVNATGVASFFLNGVKFYQEDATGTYNASATVRVGADETPANYLSGRLQQATYWNRALNADEVMNTYKFGPTASPSGRLFDYRFDIGDTAVNVPDRSGNANDGTPVGIVYDPENVGKDRRLSSTGFSYAGVYNGSTSQVQVNTDISTRVASATGVTFATWVKMNALTGAQQDLMFLKNSGGATGFSMVVTTGNVFTSTVRSRNGGTTASGAGSARFIDTKSWYHVACSMDYANQVLRFYINGEMVRQATTALEDLSYECGSGEFSLGSGNSTRYASAKLVDSRVYKKALSQDEIKQIMAGGDPDNSTIVGRYNYESASTATVSDTSGYGTGANGTATALTLTTDLPY